MAFPLFPCVFERGAGGVPTTTTVALPALPTRYEHTISDRFGFESMTIRIPVRPTTAQDWLDRGLMRSAIVYNPDGGVAWEGFAQSITATLGQKRASVSMDAIANRVRCKYTTVLDSPGTTATASHSASQALYGVKDMVVTLDKTTATEAAYKRDRVLTERALPRSAETSEARSGAAGDVTLELAFVGWYATLAWLVFGATSTSTSSATTQVGSFLTTIAATNPFISTSTLDIAALGRTATQYTDADTPYRAKIEDLLGLGDTSGNPLTWGVYEGRTFRVAAWAGASPSGAGYVEQGGEACVLLNGMRIAPWDVRPNMMSTIRTFTENTSLAGTIDTGATRYIGRVTCTIDGDSAGVTLEPSETSDITAQIARLIR